MTRPRAAVFCDFDGTVTERDVGYNLFHHFSGGRNDALLPDWKAGRMSTRDCLLTEAKMVHAPSDEILSFIDRFSIDPSFPRFVTTCRDDGVPVVVLSEGMDFYIKRILARNNLADLDVMSNMGFLEGDTIRIEFPYRTKTCEGCGNCKAQRIKEYRERAGTAERIVFVGDGYSDACGANEADVVFAKKDLQQYCQDEGISYNTFRDFDDVTEQLVDLGLLSRRQPQNR